MHITLKRIVRIHILNGVKNQVNSVSCDDVVHVMMIEMEEYVAGGGIPR